MKNWAKLANNVFTNLVCQCAQTDLAYPPFQIRARAWSAYLRISRDSLTARACVICGLYKASNSVP